MNSQEIRSLQEAYNQVYELDEATAMAKRGLDEPAIRSAIAKKTGGGSFADKATKLADRQTYGDKKKKDGRENLARKQRGDFRDTTSSSPGLHGYAYKSDDPKVKAKQSARGKQRGALTPNEKKQLNNSYDLYDVILSHLIDEGYADTEESALVIMGNMSEEWRQSIVEGLVDAVASGAGTVVGTAQRAAREIPKYVQQKVKNVAGTYEYARQRADANAPSGKMTTNPRSREFSHGNQGGKPAPMKPMKTMKNPGPNFGRG